MFFFFKQKTAYEMRISDWSSDVCSSDLLLAGVAYAPTISGDLNKTFVSKFKAAYNEDPGKYSMSGYNTIHIIADAIKRAGAAEQIGRASCRERVCQYV